MRPLARRVLAALVASETPPDQESLARFILNDEGFQRAWARRKIEQRRFFWVVPKMVVGQGASASWDVPSLPTPAALAQWLQIELRYLDWFADTKRWEAVVAPGRLRHYSYQWQVGRSGKRRLLEVPKPRLKAIQRRLLREILERIPPHEAVHGYRRGRSVASYSLPHCGQAIVLRFDLRHYFPSVPGSRVHALFRAVGYPREVARLLTGLCTNTVPGEVLDALPDNELWSRYRSPHLPQGAPTSPVLANLCSYRLDCRLAGLAQAMNAWYTRYADDLAFSGGVALERSARRFQILVCRIALEEGFEVNTRKSRFMRQGVRQQLAGVVLNRHLNIMRGEFDRLRAILHNCVRYGPASQNRDGHNDFKAYLAGRIAYIAMLNAERAQRLRAQFHRVPW